MEIRIYTVKGVVPDVCLGIIDNYESFSFTKSFKAIGSWEIKGYLTDEVKDLLKINHLIWVNERVAGIIDGVEFVTDEAGITTYTVYGSELKNVLAYRVLFFNNYIQPNGNIPSAEGFLRLLVYQNGVETPETQAMFDNQNRGIVSYVETPDNNYHIDNIGTPELNTFFELGEGLFDCLNYILTNINSNAGMEVGFEVFCTPQLDNSFRTVFKLVEGENRTYESENPFIISRELDNVATLSLTSSNKNSIHVVQLLGADKRVVTDNLDEYRQLNRKEAYVEATDISREKKQPDNTTIILDEATYTRELVEEAFKARQSDIFSLEVTSVSYGMPDYSLLGAKCTILDKEYNVRTDDWISEIVFIDEGGAIETTFILGEDVKTKYIRR